MLQPSLRQKRIRIRRITDDPGFARVLSQLLQDGRDTALPSAEDLNRQAIPTPADIRAALRLMADARDEHPDLDPLDALIATGSVNLATSAASFRAGTLSAAAWTAALLALIKHLQIAASVLAYGGTSALTPARWHIVSQIIRAQYSYAVRFASDVLDGRQRRNGRLDTRAALYAAAARPTVTAIKRRAAYESGMKFERNVLGDTDQNCVECLNQADRGWVPLGTLSQPGTRQCRANCRCTLQFSNAPSVHMIAEVA